MKIFRAAFGDESRVLLIAANSLYEATEIANNKMLEEEVDYTFSEEDTFEINPASPQILDDFSLDFFI